MNRLFGPYYSRGTIRRHDLLPLVMLMMFMLSMVHTVAAQAEQPEWKLKIVSYLSSLQKPGGAYGWADQPDAHLTPTFASVGTLDALGMIQPHIGNGTEQKLVAIVRNLHPQTGSNKEGGNSGTEMRNLIFEQIQTLHWLGANAETFREMVSKWSGQKNKVSNFETHGHPVFMQELMKIFCYDLLKLPADTIIAEVRTLLQSRRRANGSYNNAPSIEGGDGNLLNTYFGIKAQSLIGGRIDVLNDSTIAWIKKCQLASGAFTHQPGAGIGSDQDIVYTWAAVSTLTLLGSVIPAAPILSKYIFSLQNPDGGFCKIPGLPSDPVATYYAVKSLQQIGAMEQLAANKTGPVKNVPAPDYNGYQIYSAQFEAPGFGNVEEAILLAKQLKIDLWGTKNENPSWISSAQRIAKQQGVAVEFFNSDEPYGKNVHIPGMGTFNHILDYIAPLHSNIQFADSPTWKDFRTKTLQSLIDKNGALIWQVSNNEPMARLLLDEAVTHGSYAAISTIHFSQNFLFWLPFLYQYRWQLPFIALQDAHGSESWWWANELSGYRNLYLAKKPGYEGLINALKNNLVVAVRHDSVSDFRNRMLGGAPGLQEHLRKHIKEWQWWQNDTDERGRPWAVITVLTGADSTGADSTGADSTGTDSAGTDSAVALHQETGCPRAGHRESVGSGAAGFDAAGFYATGSDATGSDAALSSATLTDAGYLESGVSIRIRTWWKTNLQFLLDPMVELEQVFMDGRELATKYTEQKDGRGQKTDAFHLALLPSVSKGKHVVKIIVRHLNTNRTKTIEKIFII